MAFIFNASHKLRSEVGDFFAALCKKDDKFTESDLMRLLGLIVPRNIYLSML